MKSVSRWILLLPFAVIVLAIVVQSLADASMQVVRHVVFDQYQRWQPRAYIEAPVRVIDIDEESLTRFGQWPWPRTLLARMSARLTGAGVAAIGFDVMFAEADRTSPRAIADLWRLDGGLRRDIEALPDHDQLFARQLAQSEAVLGFALTRSGNDDKSPARKAAFVNLGENQIAWVHGFAGAVPALPELENAARGNGALTFVPDNDGVVRRVPLVLRQGDLPLPTLVSESLRVAQAAPVIFLRSAGHLQQMTGSRDNAGLGEIRIGELSIPTTPQGEIWVHYSGHQKARSLPAWRVLEDDAALASLAGHIVLVGSSAQGLMDLRFSPFGLVPGVEVHAEALEQILTGHYLERPAWAKGLEFAALVAGGLLAGFLALRTRAMVAAGACLLLMFAAGAGSWLAFAGSRLLIDPSLPLLGILWSFALCSLAHHFITERDQRWIRTAFARYVSPNRVAHLLEHQEDMALGGQRRTCSFIFTDLAGFTSLMEGIDPARAVALLNDYLDGMIAIAFRHEGTLDRIVGDAVAIMFSAPLAQADHCARALACAQEMDAFASDYSRRLNDQGIPFGATRIGVHAGEVIVGNFGGKTMFDYRALGDPVNTAARLESANKHLGTCVCVSESILAEVPDAEVRPVGKVVFKGKTRALAVFETLGPSSAPGRAPLDRYLTAYRALVGDPAAATRLFTELHADHPDDRLVAMQHRRLQDGQGGDLIVLADK